VHDLLWTLGQIPRHKMRDSVESPPPRTVGF
jgi:hypothetical protein